MGEALAICTGAICAGTPSSPGETTRGLGELLAVLLPPELLADDDEDALELAEELSLLADPESPARCSVGRSLSDELLVSEFVEPESPGRFSTGRLLSPESFCVLVWLLPEWIDVFSGCEAAARSAGVPCLVWVIVLAM
jgi:hypothetical protein